MIVIFICTLSDDPLYTEIFILALHDALPICTGDRDHRHVGAVVAGQAVSGGADLGRHRHDRHQHARLGQGRDQALAVGVLAGAVGLERCGQRGRCGAVVPREGARRVVASGPGGPGAVGQRGLLLEVGREPARRLSRMLLVAHTRPATSSASGRVNAPAYRALPTIDPSTPSGTSSRSAARSARDETPPEATTAASVREHTWRNRSTLGPCRVPSLVTSVTT